MAKISDRPARREGHRSNGNRPSDDLLLDAARDAFDAVGYRAASMESIAERANATKPTLYAHFGSKEQLYRACLEREANLLREWLFAAYEAAADLSLEDQVRADMLAFFRYASLHPAGFGLLFGGLESGSEAQVRDDLVASITGQIAVRVRAYWKRRHHAPPQRSADLLASMVVGIAIQGGRQALTLGLPPEAVGTFATALAHAGLRNLSPEHMDDIDRLA